MRRTKLKNILLSVLTIATFAVTLSNLNSTSLDRTTSSVEVDLSLEAYSNRYADLVGM